MIRNIERAEKLKIELDKLRPISKEHEQRIMQKFRLDWNYHSNHLEGNSLSYGETKALILFGITAQGKPLKDHFEITGHDNAVKWILDIITSERPLTENFIRELHKLILKETYEIDAITPDGEPSRKLIKIGSYKQTANHVKTKTGEIFRFASPEETPALMSDLISWYREKSGSVNPILLASEFHYKFIRIHPFDDGNGRTVRILMNFILMSNGYPPVIIKTEDKHNYYSVLQQADSGQIQPFIEYIAKNLIDSLEIMIKGARGESIEDENDFDKEIRLLEQKLKEIGPKVKKVKNEESLNDLFEGSIKLFIKSFIIHCKKFEQFYLNTRSSIRGHRNGRTFENLNDLSQIQNEALQKIKEKPKNLNIECSFEVFNHSNIKPFSYSYRFEFIFNETLYFLRNTEFKEDTVEKLYSQNLTKKEIERILIGAGQKHKEFIEQRMEEGLRK